MAHKIMAHKIMAHKIMAQRSSDEWSLDGDLAALLETHALRGCDYDVVVRVLTKHLHHLENNGHLIDPESIV